MATALRPIGHEDRLSIVEHLDELRTRLVICAVTFTAAFGLCMWQNDALIDIVNRPLERTTAHARGGGPLESTARAAGGQRALLLQLAALNEDLARRQGDAALAARARELGRRAQALPRPSTARQPTTLGVAEPFTTTLTVSAYFALLFALPVVLYQLYAFVLPAFSPAERRVAVPLLAMVPLLFVAGVTFAYFVVLPPAIRFLQNFNDSSFDILVQARDYYRFVALALVSLGLLFQIPVGILAATRLGIVTPRQLRRNRRYAVLVIAVLAMLMPGTDPITMLLSMLPLAVLYEGSILLAALLDRRSKPVSSRIDPALPEPDQD